LHSPLGEDKDTLKRQREAVTKYAKIGGYQIVAEYSDDAVRGTDPVDQRPGFAAILAHIAGNGVRHIIVESASRFARDLIVQETGWRYLKDMGITLIAADRPDAFLDDGPTATMVRQILGAVSQFEKAALVAKLKGAREEGRHRQVRRPQELRRTQSRDGRPSKEAGAVSSQRSQAITA
jgi:DNA invertase Pin-like site-specific DNA recombinase